MSEGTHLFGDDAMDEVSKRITTLESFRKSASKADPKRQKQDGRFLGKGPAASTGAGRADPTGACTAETRQKEESSKDIETVQEDQPDHQSSTTSQNQAANSNPPSSWGTTLKIQDCLERNRSWSMGNGSDLRRLPLRIPQNSTDQIELPDFLPLPGTGRCDGPGSTRPPGKGSDRDMFEFGWFLQPSFHSAKEGRRVATDHKPESPKSVSQYSALQNGEHLHSPRYFETGRLYGKNRSERRIFQRQSSPKNKKYLKFRWRGISYQYKALPFGLATAPRVFSKIMQEAMKQLRERSIRLVQYLDDILVIASSPVQLREHTKIVAQCLQTLGFILSEKKCVFNPMQVIKFLGFMVDSLQMKIFLPSKKVRDLVKQCSKLLRQRTVSAHKLAHLIGKMTATIPAVLPAALHYRALQRLKNRILWRNKQNYSAVGILDKESRMDLMWWNSHLPSNNGRTLITPPVKLTMESDASTKGWGAYCQGMRAGGPWQRIEKNQHINLLELKSAFLALQTFAATKTNTHVLLRLDNRTAIAYINQKGGTHSKPLSDVACTLWNWCLRKGMTVQAEHIAGVENTRADYESRVFRDPCDWMLSRQVYLKIQTKWGKMDVDLFAARHNHQLKNYYSYRPDPGATAVDAFSQNWNHLYPYAFPPFLLVGRTLQKIRRERVQRAVVIAPTWPRQPWFPLLLEMIIDQPIYLPQSKSLLQSPLETTHPLLVENRLHLAAWLVSGILYKTRNF